MRQLPILVSTTTEEGSSYEEMPPIIRKKAIKSIKVRTADSIISKCITWFREVAYTAAGKPSFYDEISLVQFVLWLAIYRI